LGLDTANSFVVVARTCGSAEQKPEWLARVITTSRRDSFATTVSFVPTGDGLEVRREAIVGGNEVVVGPLRFEARSAKFVSGRPLLDVLADAVIAADRQSIANLLAGWRALLFTPARRDDDGRLSVDAVPSNVICSPTDHLHLIDEEWWVAGWRTADLIGRGLLLTTLELVDRVHPDCWEAVFRPLDPPASVADVAHLIGQLLGVQPATGWLADAVERESTLLAAIELRDADATEKVKEGHATRLWESLHKALADVPLGHRDIDRLAVVHRRLNQLIDELRDSGQQLRVSMAESAGLAEELQAAQDELSAARRVTAIALGHARDLQRELSALHATRTFRYTRLPRRLYGWCRRLAGSAR
jgi:hypothetical protein